MAQRDVFALGRSNLNQFLFADIGVERSGSPLTVISALARVGLDPWGEADRLARLPRSAARDGLAQLIAALPSGLWPMTEAIPIASRLVALLPGPNDSPASGSMPARARWEWMIAAAMFAVLLAASAVRFATTPETAGPAPGSVSAPVVAPSHPVQAQTRN
jgi:hypothetical protein